MTAQPSYAPPPPPAPPPSFLPNWVRWLGLGCGAFLLLGAVVGSVFFVALRLATAGPEKTVKAFLAAAATGDFAAAHGYFSEPLKRAKPLAQFSQEASPYRHLFAVTDTTFSNRSVDMSGAELSGSVTLQSGTTIPAAFKLVRENGQWRLSEYQIGTPLN